MSEQKAEQLWVIRRIVTGVCALRRSSGRLKSACGKDWAAGYIRGQLDVAKVLAREFGLVR